MPSTNHYDVIIIGTGAGGGTLAYRLAPTGKRILILERGDYVAAREGQLEHARGQRRGKYQTKEVVARRATASRSIRTPTTTSAATPSSTARRSSGCARQDFGELRHHGGVSPAWPISYDDLEPYYTAGRASLSRARRARRGSDRAAGERAVSASGGQPRAAHPAVAATTSRAGAAGRSTCRSASCSTSSNPHDQPLHPLRHLRRLSVPGVRQVRRPGRLRRPRARASRTSRC